MPTIGVKFHYFGDYELLEEIARGGMGIVFKARQISLNRLVALKLISVGTLPTEELVKRFKAEAEAAASLSHPNIVPIHEIGEHQGQHYFSMGLIEGPNLREALDQIRNQKSKIGNKTEPPHTGCYNPREAARLVCMIARAMHYAHQRGVLHRDIKPSNILLDASGEPHLTDFGLAKLIEKESTLTHTNAVMGTPAYMSPEQARGETKNVTTAADVYGLGAVLYETLTGSPPFAGGTSMETVRQVLEQEPRRPSVFNSAIDRDLETICLKCLEKEPRRRYASAAVLAEDLERWQKGKTIIARNAGPSEKFWRWCLREPVMASLISFIVFGIVFCAWLLSVEQTARRQAAVAEREKKHLLEEAGLHQTNELRLRETLADDRRLWPDTPAKWIDSLNRLVSLLVHDKKFDDAVSLLNDALNSSVASQPAGRKLLGTRADLCARSGRWQQAIADLNTLISLEPGQSYHYHRLGPLLVAVDDVHQFRQLCRTMVTRFNGSLDPGVTGPLLKNCLILPDSGLDPGIVAAWAEIGLKRGTNDPYVAFAYITKGLAEYRSGNFESAAEWMNRTLAEAGHEWDHMVHLEAFAVLAMADFHLKRGNEARTALAKGIDLAQTELPTLDSKDLGAEWSLGWIDLLIGHALLKQAQNLIEADSKSIKQPKK